MVANHQRSTGRGQKTSINAPPLNFYKASLTRERNRSTSFHIVPKSETLKGCVQTETLHIEPFRSKKWND